MHILIIVSIVLAAIYCVPALAALAGELLVIAFVAAVIFAILGGLWMGIVFGGWQVAALIIGAAAVFLILGLYTRKRDGKLTVAERNEGIERKERKREKVEEDYLAYQTSRTHEVLDAISATVGYIIFGIVFVLPFLLMLLKPIFVH